MMCFNSNMVRLKAHYIYLQKIKVHEFQFQYGSIKSYTSVPVLNNSATFQFQYGSIKRLVVGLLRKWIPSFNSNMVRLKDGLGYEAMPRIGGFNSNMVRLKEYLFYGRYWWNT